MINSARRGQRSDALRNAERIARAAREAISSRGPAVSLDDVARRAGVGIATLYRHYPERSAVVRAALQLALTEALAPVRPEAEDPRDALRAMFDRTDRVMTFADDERALLSAANDAGVVATAFADVVLDDLGRLLELARDRGQIRADMVRADAPRLMVMLLSVLVTTEPGERGWRRYSALLAGALSADRAALPLPPVPASMPHDRQSAAGVTPNPHPNVNR